MNADMVKTMGGYYERFYIFVNNVVTRKSKEETSLATASNIITHPNKPSRET